MCVSRLASVSGFVYRCECCLIDLSVGQNVEHVAVRHHTCLWCTNREGLQKLAMMLSIAAYKAGLNASRITHRSNIFSVNTDLLNDKCDGTPEGDAVVVLIHMIVAQYMFTRLIIQMLPVLHCKVHVHKIELIYAQVRRPV